MLFWYIHPFIIFTFAVSTYLISDSPRLEPSFNQLKCICTAQVCKNLKKTLYSLQMQQPLPFNFWTLNSWLNILAECGKRIKETREMYTIYDYTSKVPYSTMVLLTEADKGQLVLKVWVTRLNVPTLHMGICAGLELGLTSLDRGGESSD